MPVGEECECGCTCDEGTGLGDFGPHAKAKRLNLCCKLDTSEVALSALSASAARFLASCDPLCGKSLSNLLEFDRGELGSDLSLIHI